MMLWIDFFLFDKQSMAHWVKEIITDARKKKEFQSMSFLIYRISWTYNPLQRRFCIPIQFKPPQIIHCSQTDYQIPMTEVLIQAQSQHENHPLSSCFPAAPPIPFKKRGPSSILSHYKTAKHQHSANAKKPPHHSKLSNSSQPHQQDHISLQFQQLERRNMSFSTQY